MRHPRTGRLRHQVDALRRQFLQEGGLPFADVLTADGLEQALREIKNLPNPNELYLRVVEEMYEPQAVEARLGKEADEAKADDGA